MSTNPTPAELVAQARKLADAQMLDGPGTAADIVRQLATALEGAQVDTRRYEFLRRFRNFQMVDDLLDTTSYDTLDAAIDAAMQAAGQAKP